MMEAAPQGNAWEHPTSILLLDDDEAFVRSLAAALAPHAVAPFTAPGAALRHLHALDGLYRDLPSRYERSHDQGAASADMLDARAAVPRALIASPDRFAMVDVAIVDQVMPASPGTVFCRQARELGVKTILLSGRMNDGEALAAFNNGDIDRYVAKNDPDALSKITRMSEELRRLRLRERTAALSACLGDDCRELIARHDLWQVLAQVGRVFAFCEHYFDPIAPGFLLVAEDGDYRLLLVGDVVDQRHAASLVEDMDGRTPEWSGLDEGRMIAWNILDAVRPNDFGEIDLSRFIFPANRHGSLVWSLLAPELIPVDYLKPSGSWQDFRAHKRVRELDV